MSNIPNTKLGSENPPFPQGHELLEEEEQSRHPFLRWWYHWTAIPDAPTCTSFIKREAARRSRLTSLITLIFIIFLIVLIPSALTVANTSATPMLLSLLAICLIVLFTNRIGKTIVAGIILVIAAEAVLTSIIFTTIPFYDLAIDLYSLYIVTEFLAVSLLPKESVFLAASANCVIIWYSLTYQPKTDAMITSLYEQGNYFDSLFLQIALQIAVAGIAFIWVSSMTKALKRADRAEMVAALEHRLAQQSATAQQEKQELEESIQQLVKVYVDGTKNQLITKIPYPPAKMLWPLVGVLNALWVRLQNAHKVEQDLQKLEQAIISYTELLRTAQQFTDQPLPPTRTKTALDPLIIATRQLYARIQSQHP